MVKLHSFVIVVLITFLLGCSSDTIEEPSEILQPFEEIDSSAEPIEELVQEDYDLEVQQDSIQKESIKVILEDFYLQEDGSGGYDYYFVIKTEDTILDDQKSRDVGNFFLRNPLIWFGNIYNHRSNVKELFLCDFSHDDRFWYNTYCINNVDLDHTYFGQKVRFVYTTSKHNEIKDETLYSLITADQTYVFDIVIPEEYYYEE